MTIGQLARQGGVNVETIRYYQRRGPVPDQLASTTSESRVRRYDQAIMRRLRFIKSAQATGFTLTEIVERLELDASSDRARARELADARITAIEKTIGELDAARRALVGLSRQRAAADTPHCPIISTFEQV
ncbi:MAG: MerR family transcriptional regulator [Sphingopyxis sp.]|nr:MerR family transcriptional regulator [Sphingopyxis sp.]